MKIYLAGEFGAHNEKLAMAYNTKRLFSFGIIESKNTFLLRIRFLKKDNKQ